MNAELSSKTRWGRSRFGGGAALLIGISLIAGAALALGAGLLFAKLNAPQNPVFATLIMAAALWPILSVIFWVLLVDRNTVRGSLRNPEISIEGQRHDEAVVKVFQDLMIICGLGAAVFSFINVQASVSLVLTGVLLLTGADFILRYFLIKRAQS